LGAIESQSFPERPYSTLDFVDSWVRARDGFIVASVQGSVVGYVIGISEGKDGMIQSIAVAPEARRAGVGRMLMQAVIEHLTKKHQRITLLVDSGNEAAIRLYRKFRFSETGRVVEAYYPNGNDAIEMVRENGSRPAD
jgi:ribosomal-protein-alanine N-acetyltransferase